MCRPSSGDAVKAPAGAEIARFARVQVALDARGAPADERTPKTSASASPRKRGASTTARVEQRGIRGRGFGRRHRSRLREEGIEVMALAMPRGAERARCSRRRPPWRRNRYQQYAAGVQRSVQGRAPAFIGAHQLQRHRRFAAAPAPRVSSAPMPCSAEIDPPHSRDGVVDDHVDRMLRSSRRKVRCIGTPGRRLHVVVQVAVAQVAEVHQAHAGGRPVQQCCIGAAPRSPCDRSTPAGRCRA